MRHRLKPGNLPKRGGGYACFPELSCTAGCTKYLAAFRQVEQVAT